MSALTFQFLQLLIVPFKNESLFVWLAGLLSVSWLLDTIFKMIRGYYS